VGLHYSWDFSLNIKTAGKIKRLASTNHEIEYSIWEEGTLASVNLKQGEKRNLGKDFVLYF
jgi:hypothetical protein